METTYTNHDTSADGLSIEVSAFLDSEAARHEFETCFHVHQSSGYRTTAVYEYSCPEGNPPAYSVLDCYRFSDELTPRQFRRALFDWHMTCGHQYFTPTARNFFDEYGFGDVDWRDTFMDELERAESVEDFAKQGDSMSDFLPSELVIPQYEVKASTGYCQGDYALVLVPVNVTEGGASLDFIDNLIWDAPVYCRIEITDSRAHDEDPTGGHEIGTWELYADEYLTNRYAWDTEEIMQGLRRETCHHGEPIPEEALAQVEDMLPEYPGRL